MTVYVGGLRVRLIRESLYQTILEALTALGWFDADRKHKPVEFLASITPDFETVQLNTGALSDMEMTGEDWEMGSRLSENRWTLYVDFFGENDAVSTHFIHDVKDILQGRMPSIGRDSPDFAVLDFMMATPSAIFRCEIENVMIDRPTVFDRQFQRHWMTCRFDVLDYYGTEEDS